MRRLFLFLLLAAGLFVASRLALTNWSFRTLWLPRIAQAAGLQLATADKTSWDPARGFTIEGLNLGPGGAFTGTVRKLNVRYNFGALRRGLVLLDRIDVEGARLTRQVQPRKTPKPKSEKTVSKRKHMQKAVVAGIPLAVGPVSLNDAAFTWRGAGRSGETSEVALHFEKAAFSGYTHDKATDIDVNATLRVQRPRFRIDAGRFAASGVARLDADFNIREISGQFELTGFRGASARQPFDGLAASGRIDRSIYWLKEFNAAFTHRGKPCGDLRARGQFDQNVRAMDIIAALNIPEPAFANVFLAQAGLLLDSGSLRVSGQIALGEASSRLQPEIRLENAVLRTTIGAGPFPPLDGAALASGTWDHATEVLALEHASGTFTRAGRPLFDASLEKPARFDFSGTPQPSDPATFTATVPQTPATDLAETFASLGVRPSGGTLNGSARVTVAESGRRIDVEAASLLDAFAGNWRGIPMRHGAVRAQLKAAIEDFRNIASATASVTVFDGKTEACSWSGEASGKTGNGTFLLGGNGDAAWLLSLFSPACSVTSGVFTASAEGTWTGAHALQATYGCDASGISGSVSGLALNRGTAKINGEWNSAGPTRRIPSLRIELTPVAGRPPGVADLAASWDARAGLQSGRATLAGWTSDNLGPFLRDLLPGRAITIGGLSADATLESQGGNQNLSATVEAVRIAAVPPGGNATPIDLQAALKGTGRTPRIDLTGSSITLGPSGAPNPPFTLSGWFENARKFDLKIEGAMLDLNPVRPFWHGLPEARAAKRKSEAPPPPARATPSRKGARSEPNPPPPKPAPQPAPAAPAPGDPSELDRRLAFRIAQFALSPWPEAALKGEIHQTLDKWEARGIEAAIAEGKIAAGAAGSQAGVSADTVLHNLPLAAFTNAAPRSWHPCLTGVASGRIRGSWTAAAATNWLSGIAAGATLNIQEAALETIPATASFLNSAAKYVSPELAASKITSAQGDFTAAAGVIQTENLTFSGDLLRVAVAGRANAAGDLDCRAAFTGRRDVLERAQINAGSVVIGGKTFVAFGKTVDGFTTLPGALPVRGNVHGDIKADWTGWLTSVGSGAGGNSLQSVLAGLLDAAQEKDKPKAPKPDKKK